MKRAVDFIVAAALILFVWALAVGVAIADEREALQRWVDEQQIVTLHNVAWSGGRATADYTTENTSGTLTFWIKNGEIEQIAMGPVMERRGRTFAAELGQIADKTLASTAVEGNPALSGAGGLPVAGVLMLGMSWYVERTESLHECVQSKRVISSVGWTGAASLVHPVAMFLAAIAGWHLPGRGDCEGAVQVAVMVPKEMYGY